MNSHKTFTDAYLHELRAVFDECEHTCSPRGQLIKENLCSSFKIENPRDRLPFIHGRLYNPQYMAAECLWYLAGIRSVEWISPYAPFWTKISDDGTNVNSAYGARIFRSNPAIGIDQSQWEWVKRELTRDPDSRRAFIHIRLPHDSFNAVLDVPCTIGFQFFIRDNALHMWASMRSSDLWLGLANDVPAFTLFQELMALELGLKLGSYNHTGGSVHIYERDFDKVKAVLSSNHAPVSQAMPAMTSLPPLDKMLALESQIRSAQIADQIRQILTRASSDIDPYWFDFILLLGAFWLRKRSTKEESAAFVRERCAWSGWSFEGFR